MFLYFVDPLIVNMSVLLLSLASPDESSLVSRFLFHVTSHAIKILNNKHNKIIITSST